MNKFNVVFVLGVFSLSFVGCSTGLPQARLGTYISSPSSSPGAVDLPKTGVFRAAIVVVNDTSSKDSAPKLSPASLEFIKNHAQSRLIKEVQLPLVDLESSLNPSSSGELDSLMELAKDKHVDYLVFAVVSSTEIEVPDRLPLQGSLQGGGARGVLNGYRAENFALAELALLDVQTRQVLIQSDGQAWASLERLDVPLESNVYPVVRHAQEIAPIYPEKESQAHDILRAVASSDAINQAVMHFKETWGQAKG